MNIDKAIEILDLHILKNEPQYIDDLEAATKLGIVALKGIMALRRGRGKAISELLPGETELEVVHLRSPRLSPLELHREAAARRATEERLKKRRENPKRG